MRRLHESRRLNRPAALILLGLALGACSQSAGSLEALCILTDSSRAGLVNALLEDGGDKSVISGEYLLRQIGEACGAEGAAL